MHIFVRSAVKNSTVFLALLCAAPLLCARQPQAVTKADGYEPLRLGPGRAQLDDSPRSKLPFRMVTEEVSELETDPVPLSSYTGLDSDLHGPSGCFADFNNDGWQDLYLPEDNSRNYLYENVPDGDEERKFRQVPEYLTGVSPGYKFRPTGAIAGDFDNDGDLDIYVLNSNRGLLAGLGAPDCSQVINTENVLLRNRWVEDGVLRFEAVTAFTDPTPGLADDQHGVAFAFDITLPGATGEKLDDSVTAAWADVDRDGDLDLFVGNHDNHDQQPTPDPCDPEDKYGQRDILYLNLLGESEAANGVPHFVDVTLGTVEVDGARYGGRWDQEADPVTGWQLPRTYETADIVGWQGENDGFETEYQRFSSSNAAMFVDVNMDLWPDLVVTNKAYGNDCRDRDMLYLNLGADSEGNWLGFAMSTYTIDTVMTTEPPCDQFGANHAFGSMTPGAMGIDCADFDGDGDVDMFFSDRGISDLWENLSVDLGLEPGDDPVFSHSFETFIWGWGVRWDDYDNNGLLDLHVTTRNTYHDWLWMQTPGSTIGTDMSVEMGVSQGGETGPFVHSRANLTADYDHDGWLDIFVVNRNAPPSALFHNQMGDPSAALPVELAPDTSSFHSVTLRLIGNTTVFEPTGFASSRNACGALVKVVADHDGNGSLGARELVYREVHAGAGNAAGTSDMALHIGLGRASEATIDISWPSGRTTSIEFALADGATHQILTVTE